MIIEYKGIVMNGVIATWYAKNTGRSLDAYCQDARRVAAYLSPGSRVLEVAPGPGSQAIELAKLGASTITGVDISPSFVRIASENARAAGVHVAFRHGNAADLPFTANIFDLIILPSHLQELRVPADGKIALGFTPYAGQPKRGLPESLTAAAFTETHVVETALGFCALAIKP